MSRLGTTCRRRERGLMRASQSDRHKRMVATSVSGELAIHLVVSCGGNSNWSRSRRGRHRRWNSRRLMRRCRSRHSLISPPGSTTSSITKRPWNTAEHQSPGSADEPATRRASSLEPLTRLEPCHESRAWERTSFAPQKPPARHARDAREFGGGAGGLCKVIRVSPKVRRSG
jgi:hypothetical protein